MRPLLFALIVLCSTPLAVAAAPGQARWGTQAQDQPRYDERQLSVEQAAHIAQRRVGGRVLAAEREQVGDRSVVRVKLLTREGVVRVVVVDAATGQVLR